MKDTKSFVAPTDTATLIACQSCEGDGMDSQKVRIVSTNGHELMTDAVCHECNGSGYLWEDTRFVTQELGVEAWQFVVAVVGVILMIAPMLFFMMADSLIGATFWMPVALLLFIVILVLGQERTKNVEQKFYTKTSEPVQIKGKLMQQ